MLYHIGVKKYLTVKNITVIGILSALGAVLMLIDFPIFVAPSFYKMDLGDLPCLIGALALGPIPALFIQIIKIFLKLLIKPTSTAFVGEIAAFIFSSAYCISAALVYKLNKTKKGALIALLVASIVEVIVASIINYLFIIDAYTVLYHIPLDVIIAAGQAIFSVIDNKLSFILLCVAPFNLIKVVIIDIITMFVYKRVSYLLK